jgi:hypothetical protein|uniref:Uncharacterized protein n=1 Tax=Desulfobacca acetoxidans TaxID=60893 RepID=A0A7V6DP69_9BACT
MSTHMQIVVKVTPYYQEDFSKTFPKLARHLGHLDAALVRSNPSLYALAGKLDKLLYTFDGTEVRDVLLKHRKQLQGLYQEIEARIADWHLAEADKLLYKMEDIFEEIEGELS